GEVLEWNPCRATFHQLDEPTSVLLADLVHADQRAASQAEDVREQLLGVVPRRGDTRVGELVGGALDQGTDGGHPGWLSKEARRSARSASSSAWITPSSSPPSTW